ncbi:MAG TPA: TadE family type IV pilus minor pilin [Micromonosporaceae bacterium]|nr:TadE family type IV pilus minor pilin [Micromonosporaceae bacterium]
MSPPGDAEPEPSGDAEPEPSGDAGPEPSHEAVRDSADRGSVTAELAAALPAIILLLLAALTGVAAVGVQLRCVDAAAQAARTEARGGDGAAAGRLAAPPGAVVTVEGAGDTVRASVQASVRPFGRRLPGFPVRAVAVAMREPGEPGAPGWQGVPDSGVIPEAAVPPDGAP